MMIQIVIYIIMSLSRYETSISKESWEFALIVHWFELLSQCLHQPFVIFFQTLGITSLTQALGRGTARQYFPG